MSSKFCYASPSSDDHFHALMRHVREGSADAAWEIVERYQGHIRRAVRRVITRKLRAKFDSLDFVQLAWLSFFRLPKHAKRIERPEHLVKYLAGMACKKLKMAVRQNLDTQKRNARREVSFHAAVGREPEPVEIAIAKERWEELLSGQPAHYREIVRLKLRGESCAEIGRKLDLDPDTARRFLKRLAGGISYRGDQQAPSQAESTHEHDSREH